MFKNSKYCPNEDFFHLYKTTPHTLGQIFKSSNKLIKQISINNAAIAVYDAKIYLNIKEFFLYEKLSTIFHRKKKVSQTTPFCPTVLFKCVQQFIVFP
jgi:hypothetical protein